MSEEQYMQRVFQLWQIRLQRITETNQLQAFKTHSQERFEDEYNSFEELKVSNTELLLQIESTEKVVKKSLQKTMKLLESRKNRLNKSVVKIFAKRNIRLLNNAIKECEKELTELQKDKLLCKKEQKDLLKLQQDLYQEFEMLQLQIEDKSIQLFKGLLPERIEKFDKFTADESYVNNQCAICMENVEVGMNMIRLDCDGQHEFCKKCITSWFAVNNTCPVCRHLFQ